MPQVITPPLNGANRFAHIDAMRAFAVLLVVVAHAGLGKIVPGGSGVTIFFSISGFIITHLLLRERDRTGDFSASAFYFRRAVKIGPPFVLIIAIPTVISSLWSHIDWAAFLGQVLFVFNWLYIDSSPSVLDGSDVVWSLAIEEQFYIAFALFWLFAAKLRSWRFVVTTVALVAVMWSTLSRVLLASDSSLSDRIYYGSDTRLDGIAWGVLAAVVFHWLQSLKQADIRLSRFLASDWTLIGAVSLYLFSLILRDDWFRDTFRYSVQSLAACAVILYGLLPGRGPLRRLFYSVSQWRFVSLIGLASYSIYLIHLVIMNFVRDRLVLALPVKVAVLSVLGVAAGILVYRFVELPIHRWSLKLRGKGRESRRSVPSGQDLPA